MQLKKKEVESAFAAAWTAKLFGLRFFDFSTVARNAPQENRYSHE